MIFIIDDSINDVEKKKMIKACINNNVEYILVKSIPFTEYVLPVDVDVNSLREEEINTKLVDLNKISCGICFGKNSLTNVISKTNMYPGVFTNENFNYSAWIDNWGRENLLNNDVIIGDIGNINIPNKMDKFFIRPSYDNKHISGGLMKRDEFLKLRDLLDDENDGLLSKKTEVVISTPKKIQKEYRAFVVGKQVISGSMYRENFAISVKEGLPSGAILFLNNLFLNWVPDESFVIDVAENNGVYKVIEVNSLNSSGFYGADIERVFCALNTYYRGLNINKKISIFEKMCMIDYDISNFDKENGIYVDDCVQSMWIGFEMGLYADNINRNLYNKYYEDC